MTIPLWTEQSLSDFAYWVLSDFTAQIETRLEEEEIGNSEYADLLSLSASRVSQVLNDPGNLTVGNVVKFARALGMKAAIVAYDDADPNNEKGPISADVFTQSWQKLGRPRDQFDLQDVKAWIVHTTRTESTTTRRKMSVKVEKLAETDNIGKIYA